MWDKSHKHAYTHTQKLSKRTGFHVKSKTITVSTPMLVASFATFVYHMKKAKRMWLVLKESKIIAAPVLFRQVRVLKFGFPIAFLVTCDFAMKELFC